MMLASNNGVGQNIGFPDVCLTPPPPPVGPIPIPYPNFGLNVMSAVFSPNVFTGFMPALNLASIKPMTQGDNGGVLHPLFMQMGGQTMGNPFIFINCIPAKNLLVPTFGNAFNNPIGATLVPSVTTTFYTDRAVVEGRGQPVSAQQIQALAEAVEGDDEVVTSAVVNGVLHLRIRRFVADIGRRVFNATRGHEDAPITIDLRGNPGGDAHAALSLMDDFTPQGSTLAVLVQDGEHLPQRARAPQSYGGPLTILVDAETASAAEVFAGGLRALGRARLIGETTAGKGSVQALCSNRDRDGFTYESVAEYRLPDGRPIHGAGLIPDDDG